MHIKELLRILKLLQSRSADLFMRTTKCFGFTAYNYSRLDSCTQVSCILFFFTGANLVNMIYVVYMHSIFVNDNAPDLSSAGSPKFELRKQLQDSVRSAKQTTTNAYTYHSCNSATIRYHSVSFGVMRRTFELSPKNQHVHFFRDAHRIYTPRIMPNDAKS